MGPLSLTGPMGMSGAGAQSQLLCGRGTLQRVEQKPRPRLAMVFLEEFSVLFSVLIMWTSCYCHPPGWAGGGGSRATLLLSLATAQRFPLGLLRSFPQRAGFVSLPLPVQAPWAGTEPESLSPHLHTHRWAPIPHLRGRGRGLSTSSPHPGHPRPQLPGWWLRLWAHLSAGSGGDPRAPQPHPHPALSPCPLAACASCLSASVFDSSTHVCPPAPCLRAPSAPCAPPWNVTSPWRRALGAPGLGLHRAGRAVGW